VGYFEVIDTSLNTVDSWCKIKTSTGLELGCSPDHPLMSKGADKWELVASEAVSGDPLWVFDSDNIMKDDTVESVEILEETVSVYNMTVKTAHTYISNGILSHNFTGLPKGGGCVLGGTQINTDAGMMSVEDIVTGMNVLSHDFETSEMGHFKVVRTFLNTVDGWCKIKTSDGFEMRCSLDHKIMSKSADKWELIASEAAQGDHVWVFKDSELKDDIIESVEIFEDSVKVYNMTVNNVHTYIGDGILSHNFSFDWAAMGFSTAAEFIAFMAAKGGGGAFGPGT
jgi:hypothetical protein